MVALLWLIGIIIATFTIGPVGAVFGAFVVYICWRLLEAAWNSLVFWRLDISERHGDQLRTSAPSNLKVGQILRRDFKEAWNERRPAVIFVGATTVILVLILSRLS